MISAAAVARDASSLTRDQARLRTMLNATLAAASGVPLAESLSQMIDAAVRIVGCRYGVAIVRDESGQLTHFVPVGVDPSVAGHIGAWPDGKGLLATVMDGGRTLRLPDARVERGSVGVPDGHPPVTELLAMPIQATGTVTGGLFLAGRIDETPFDLEDEHAAQIVATAAGFLVDRARIAESAERQHRWLARSTELTREIVAGVHADPMQVLVDRVLEVADADLAAVVMPSTDGESLIVTSASGERAHLVRHRVIERHRLTGDLGAIGKPVVIDDLAAEDTHAWVVELLDVQSLLLVPMSEKAGSTGTLALFRYRGRLPFAQSELDMATTFAAQMVLALELAEARADRERAALFAERERIARDLHDHVIQQLFAIGMTLQSTVGKVEAQTGRRLHTAIDDLDNTILQIRSTIYRLTGPVLAGGDTLRAQAEDLLQELTPVIGFPIEFDVRGPVDFGVADAVAVDVLAVLREAVTNVAKHAGASRVTVSLDVGTEGTSLTVTDDGRGIGESTRRSGLANLRARAVQHGGDMTITSDASGTRITWCVPARP